MELLKEVEEAVVCALLVEQDKVMDVASWLKPEMFYSPELRLVYTAIVAQYEEGEQPDLMTTATRMEQIDRPLFQQMGGMNFIRPGLVRIRHADNLVVYAKEVKRQHMLRQAVALFTILVSKAQQADADCSDVMKEAERGMIAIWEELQQGGVSMQSVGELAAEVIAYHRRRTEKEEDSRCVLTGLNDLDQITGGLHPGELYILAGRPGDGKSAIAMQIAFNAAEKGKKVSFFSLEMDNVQIMNRYFTGHASVKTSHLRKETPTEIDLLLMENLRKSWENLPLHIGYTAGYSTENIRAQVLLQKKRTGCDLIVVDYLHMLDLKVAKGESLEQVIACKMRAMKQLAREADCPLLLLSQMNRNVENRTEKLHIPQLSDLRDSGTIEQVADCVFFVYRPERYGISKDTTTGKSIKGEGRLIVAKNRNGKTGSAPFRYNETFTRIYSPDPKTLF
jgi:replicative DNA helicase